MAESIVGGRQAGTGAGAVAESLYFICKTEAEGERLDLVWALETSKADP